MVLASFSLLGSSGGPVFCFPFIHLARCLWARGSSRHNILISCRTGETKIGEPQGQKWWTCVHLMTRPWGSLSLLGKSPPEGRDFQANDSSESKSKNKNRSTWEKWEDFGEAENEADREFSSAGWEGKSLVPSGRNWYDSLAWWSIVRDTKGKRCLNIWEHLI